MQCQECLDFGGKTYQRELDGKRLSRQLNDVFNLMKDGIWRTLDEISEITGHPPASVSARLRDLRKPKFGSHFVSRQRRGSPEQGVFEYHVCLHDDFHL